MDVFSTLILTVGIPGAGKTTWANKYMSKHPLTHLIRTDNIREEMFGTIECDPSQSASVHDEARKRVKAILADNSLDEGIGPVILVDSTNVELTEWLKYKKLGPSIMIAVLFDVNPEDAWERSQKKEKGAAPLYAHNLKYNQLRKSKPFMRQIFNMVIDFNTSHL